MMRAMGTAVMLAALGSGSAYAQSSVAVSATVVGRLDAEATRIAVRAGVGTIIIDASAARAASRGTLEYVQLSRITERGVIVIDDEGVNDARADVELVVDNAEEIRIVVTRVIASNS
jgi:hypothetical protein